MCQGGGGRAILKSSIYGELYGGTFGHRDQAQGSGQSSGSAGHKLSWIGDKKRCVEYADISANGI